MDRRTYRVIINTLEADGFIRARAVADTLRELARRYHALKSHPQEITPAEVEKFVEGQQIINASRALPEVTDQELPSAQSQARTQQPAVETTRGAQQTAA